MFSEFRGAITRSRASCGLHLSSSPIPCYT